MEAMNKNSTMARQSFLFLIFFLHVSLIATCCRAENTQKHAKTAVPLFVFGDSILDAGNNNYINTSTLDQANFWPYGETYFKFPTGRFSDGRVISDFIAKHANLPFIPPFLQPGFRQYNLGVNFASGGAGALVETFQGFVIDLKTQVKNYNKVESRLRQKLGNDEAKMTISRGVYLFSIGNNDYMSPFLTNSTILNNYSDSTYVGMVIGNITTAIKEIYRRGGRKFAFINLPDLGCVPGIRILTSNGSCLEKASSLANLHNEALFKLLFQLQKRLKGFKYTIFDFNTNLKNRMLHPSKYGFKIGEAACCGTGPYGGTYSCGGKRIVKEFQVCKHPNEYLFWDSFHLTEKANKQLADEMWKGKSNSFNDVGPYSLKKLFKIH
ncbi:Lipase, GDSL [Corchorus olitorius]|uniref:Lipase, GDSL n=1 Tax=Corchorus olitorius TaxID=93759 RepID=A0A1R3H6M0_9ROSI|nr:Lipase, GDSL [Corchorus olitorius]